MAEVAVSKVRPGDVLGRDVVFPDGRLLLRSGTELTDRHLLFLKSHNIETVFVGQDADRAPETPVSQEKFRERLYRLERMFAGVERQPHMSSIKEAALRQLQRPRPWEKG